MECLSRAENCNHLRRDRRLPTQAVYLTTDAPGWGNSIGTSKKKNTVAVKAHTIDEICRENELTHIDLLKVDIERAEKSCLGTRTFLNEWAAASSNFTRITHSMRLKAMPVWNCHVVEPARENCLKMI